MSAPEITIVIPAWNVAATIAETLRSALAQQDVNFEVVMVEDGCTDNTMAVVEPFLQDPRLRVVHQPNAGLPAARNAGLAVARGRHVGFLDGDDLWDPGKAAAHVALLDANPGLDLTYSWWRVIDEHSRPTGRRNCTPIAALPGGLSLEGLAIENFCGNGSTVVCRRSAIEAAGGFDATLRSCEDLDAWLRVAALREDNIGLVPEILCSYRVHSGQMTRDLNRMRTGWETAIAKARALHPQRIARVARQANARQDRYLAYIAYEQQDYALARQLIRQAWAGDARVVAKDPRSFLVTGAIVLANTLPRRWHHSLAETARRLRARAPGGGARA